MSISSEVPCPRAGRQRIQVPHQYAVSTETSCKRVRTQGSSDAMKGPNGVAQQGVRNDQRH
ncbi:hypothetical protein ABZ726_30145, partial [Streptomyces hundungensis]|uniref:hypothetical protein n=1 Tax=Streptomyces hundungensis TaxID=1077946 RepID=UPI0033FEAD47